MTDRPPAPVKGEPRRPPLPERFEVEQYVGAGAFGSVWRVQDRTSGQTRAAKLLTSHADDADWRHRFFQEYALLYRLRHPGLIRAYAYGRTGDDRPFFTMDWHDGPTLDERAIRPDQRPRVLWELCDTLSFIHRQKLIHADLKAANVKLRPDRLDASLQDEPARALTLLDFGLTMDQQLTDQDARRGTVHYMAPEWFTPGPVDHRVDLYSLGVLIFELCTGHAPFDDRDPLVIIQQHLEATAPDLAAEHGIPGAVSEATARLLAKQPEIRDRGWQLLCEFLEESMGRPPGCGPESARAHFESLGSASRRIPLELIDTWLAGGESRKLLYIRGGLGLDQDRLLKSLVPEIQRYGFAPREITDPHVPDPPSSEAGGDPEVHLIEVRPESAAACVEYLKRWLTESGGPERVAISLDVDLGAHIPLARELARGVREDLAHMVSVGCLDDGAVHGLLTQVLPDRVEPELRQAMVRLACGNTARLRALVDDFWSEEQPDDPATALEQGPQFRAVLQSEQEVLRATHPAEELIAMSLLATTRCPVDRSALRALADIPWASALSRWLDLDRVRSQAGRFSWNRPDLADAIGRMLPHRRQRIVQRAWAEYWSSYSPEPGSDEHEYLVHHSLRSDAYRRAVRVGLDSARFWTGRHQAHRALATLEEVEACLSHVEQPPPAWIYELSVALADARRVLARFAEARKGLESALEQPAIKGQLRWEADLYKRIGDLCKSLKQSAEGEAALGKALERYRRLEDRAEVSHVLNNLGNIHYMAGQLDRALECYEEALSLQRQLHQARDVASTLNNIGGLLVLRSQYADAVKRLTEAVTIKRTLNDPEELARSLNNLSVAFVETGKYNEATDVLEESYHLNVEADKTGEQLFNLENMALVAMARGEWAHAVAQCETGMQLCDASGAAESTAPFLLVMCGVALAQGNYDVVDSTHAEASRLLGRIDDPDLALWLRMFRAEWAYWKNRGEEVMDETSDVIDRARSEDLPAWMTRAYTLRARGALLLGQGDAEAGRWLKRAQELAEKIGALPEQIRTNILLAEMEVRGDRFEFASEHLRRCESMLLECGAKPLFLPFSRALGRYYLRRSDLEMALSVFDTARKLASSLSLPEWTWRFMAQTGHLLVRLKRFDEAVPHYRAGLDILAHLVNRLPEADRATYMSEPEKARLEEGLRDCWQALVGTNKLGHPQPRVASRQDLPRSY